tara:strand:+ start:17776 stop:20133 length:2358 start_codon:yes stop_codon:yes gene_type:complete
MEYKEEANIRSIGNTRLAEVEALETSAAVMQKWANRSASVYEKLVTDSAIREANKVDVTAQAPDLKNSWTKVGQVYNNIVLEGHKAAAVNDFRNQISQADVGTQLDVESFQKTLGTMKGKALENADPSIRAYLATEFDNYAVPRVGKKQVEKDAAELGVAVSSIQQKVQDDFNTAFEAAANGDINALQEAEESIYAAADQISQYDPQMADKFIKNYQTKRLTAGYVGGFRDAHADGNGDAYIAEIATKAQNITTVDENGNEQIVGLSDDVVDSITKRLKAESTILDNKKNEKEGKLRQENFKAIAALQIKSGYVQPDFDKFVSEVDAAFQMGLLGDPTTTKAINKYTSIVKSQTDAIKKQGADITKQNKDAIKIAQTNANIDSTLSGKTLVNTDGTSVQYSQKDVDRYFVEAMEGLNPEQPEQSIGLAKKLFDDTGRFPELLKNQLTNSLLSEDDGAIVAASRVIMDLTGGLNGYDVVKGEQAAFASNVVANVEAGEGTDLAVKNARLSTQSTDKDIKARGIAYSADKVASDNSEWITNNMGGNIVQDAAVKFKFETLVSNMVVNQGWNLTKAREAASLKVDSQYGDFNGNVVYMSPNVIPVYKAVDGTGEWVNKDFMKSLADLGLIDSQIDSAGARNFYLVPVDGKENDMFPVSGAPIYSVMKFTDEGPAIVTDESGSPQIYKPSLTSKIRQSQTLMPEAKQRISEKIIKTMSKKIAADNAGEVGPLGITNKAGIEQEAEAEARRMFDAGELTTSEIEKMLSPEEFDVFNLNIESANARYIGEN